MTDDYLEGEGSVVPIGAVQSTRPEDTRMARENDLVAEDFEPPEESEMLSVEDIEQAEDRVIRRVEVPEWPTRSGRPGHVFVRNPSGLEKNRFEQQGLIRRGRDREANLADLKERLVLNFTCHEDGRPLFCPDEARPVPAPKAMKVLAWLREKNSAAIERIADVALSLGGWTQADVETMAKNSEPGPS